MKLWDACSELDKKLALVRDGASVSKELWLGHDGDDDRLSQNQNQSASTSPYSTIFNHKHKLRSIQGLLRSLQTSLHSALAHLDKEDELVHFEHVKGTPTIENLPDEVLVEIFAHLLDIAEGHLSALWAVKCVIAQVSRRFYSIFFGTPTLWSRLCVDLFEYNLKFLQTCLHFSKNAKLRLTFLASKSYFQMKERYQLLKKVEAHHNRWKSVEISFGMDRDGLLSVKQLMTISTFPFVETLRLHGSRNNSDVFVIFDHLHFPALRTLDLNGFSFGPPLNILPRLTTLRIEAPVADGGGKWKNFASYLGTAGQLQVLTVTALIYVHSVSNVTSWSDDTPQPVVFPFLRSFSLLVSEFNPRDRIDRTSNAKTAGKALVWFTRALRMPCLGSFHLSLPFLSSELSAGFEAEFFPFIDVLANVEEVGVKICIVGHDTVSVRRMERIRRISSLLLSSLPSRFPHVRVLDLDLPYNPDYANLVYFPQTFSSLRHLTMGRIHVLPACEVSDFRTWCLSQDDDHAIDRFHLTTFMHLHGPPSSKFLSVARLEEYFGRTSVLWEELSPREKPKMTIDRHSKEQKYRGEY